MRASPNVVSVLFLVLCLCSAAKAQDSDLKKKVEALDAAGDRAAIVALWREHPGQTLGIIDYWLEGSLALQESTTEKPDAARIASMHGQALRLASTADEAFGSVIFSDYAASFTGWNEAERRLFREGQKAFGEGTKALKAKEWEAALVAGRSCYEKARSLGDWWGTAMGLTCMARAHEGLGQSAAAIECHAAARLINHDLRLLAAEFGNAEAMIRLLSAAGPSARRDATLASCRALAAVEKALAPRLEAVEKLVAGK